MFFVKFSIRKMHLVIFQLQLGVFSVYFLFSFSCLNSSKEKSGKQILHKVTLKKRFVYPGGGFFIHLFRVH